MTSQSAREAAKIVADAGGEIVGRTRLQKIAYLLEIAGIGAEFQFEYRHYGPFSDGLAAASRDARLSGLISEETRVADWGGSYSVYRSVDPLPSDASRRRLEFIGKAMQADSVVLELAATAVFLAKDGCRDAWAETTRRKPDKADGGRLEKAKALYRELKYIAPLPEVA
jgi:uncharacterized protein